METHSQPMPEFISYLSKTFSPKSKGQEWFGKDQGIWAAPVRSCPQLFLHFIHATELPFTCTWTPTSCDAPFSQEGEPGGCVLNPGLQSYVMETWAEKQHWKTDGCTLENLFTCAGRLWRHSLASHMLLRDRGWDEGFWSITINGFLSICVTKVIWGFSLWTKYRLCKSEHLPLSRWAREAVQCKVRALGKIPLNWGCPVGQMACSAAWSTAVLHGVAAIHADSLPWDQGERLPSGASSPTAGREPYCLTQHVELSTLGEKM